ncbi:MAG: hypothetical protein QOF87_2894 [Pseudonocardiales bacterium]|nr:hypothetical protein [Pseudonocardiales bacterium]
MATQLRGLTNARAGSIANQSHDRQHTTTQPSDDPLTRALGWASLGLGIPQLAAPGWFARFLGVGDGPRQRLATTVVGVRELAAAFGLLTRPAAGWLWARVAGDAMDLTLLGRALKNHDGRGRQRTFAATAAVVGITVVDLYAALTRSWKEQAVELTATTTVVSSPQEAYGFWRQLENLPTFMAHLEEVHQTGDRTSHWRVREPLGGVVEWDAEITLEIPGERISWKSTPNAAIPSEGTVRFVPAPGNRGTEIHVAMTYEMPAGKLGETVARFFGEEPHQQLDDDLRRLKQVLETGEVVRSEGAPGGKRARREFPQHPARPLTREEMEEEVYA